MKKSDADWLESVRIKKRRCGACNDEARDEIPRVLAVVNEAKAFSIGAPAVYRRVCELHPGFEDRVGYDTFRKHLTAHEPTWHRHQKNGAK